MDDPGLVALDPLALARLEGTLHGLADAYRTRVGALDEVLAGTGESAEEALADLRRVAAWCRLRCEDISRRRQLLAALPVALPLPAWTFGDPTAARRQATGLAARLVRALDHHPPSWAALARLLAEVDRGGHDGAFAAHLLALVGPERAAALPLRIEQAARGPGGPGPGPAGPGEGPTVDALHQVVARAVLAASRHRGPGALTEEWAHRFAGRSGGGDEPEGEPDPATLQLLHGLGFGLTLARAVALGMGGGTVAVVLRGTNQVVAVARVVAGARGQDLDGWDGAGAVATGLSAVGLYAVAVGAVATPLGAAVVLGGSVVASALAWLMANLDGPPAESATSGHRHRRSNRAYDPGTDAVRFPGGGTDRPHQDGAGGVLPPTMTR